MLHGKLAFNDTGGSNALHRFGLFRGETARPSPANATVSFPVASSRPVDTPPITTSLIGTQASIVRSVEKSKSSILMRFESSGGRLTNHLI